LELGTRVVSVLQAGLVLVLAVELAWVSGAEPASGAVALSELTEVLRVIRE